MFRLFLISLPFAVLSFSIALYNLRQTLCTHCSGRTAEIFRCSELRMTALKVGDSFPEGVEFLYAFTLSILCSYARTDGSVLL